MIKYRHKETGLFLKKRKVGYRTYYLLDKKGTVYNVDCIKNMGLCKYESIRSKIDYYKPEEFELVRFNLVEV